MVQFLTQPSEGPGFLAGLRQLTLQAKERARDRAFQARLADEQREFEEQMLDKQLAAQVAGWQRDARQDVKKTRFLEKGRAERAKAVDVRAKDTRESIEGVARLDRGAREDVARIGARSRKDIAKVGMQEAVAKGQLDLAAKFGGGIRKFGTDVAKMFSPEAMAKAGATRALTGLRNALAGKAQRTEAMSPEDELAAVASALGIGGDPETPDFLKRHVGTIMGKLPSAPAALAGQGAGQPGVPGAVEAYAKEMNAGELAQILGMPDAALASAARLCGVSVGELRRRLKVELGRRG